MADLLVSEHGTVGRLTLNRPAALNALTLGMVRDIDAALSAWVDDRRIGTVLIEGAGDRAFCAGGDIRALYDDARAGRFESMATFFHEEFRLNARLARYAKPVVTVMSGLTMGGGIGIGAHAAHRIVTGTSKLAMPEVGIGYFTDVGGTFLLGTAPGELGTYAALTGVTLAAADAIACGLADLFLDAAALADLPSRLDGCRDPAQVRVVLGGLAGTPGGGMLAASAGWIGRCFAGDSVASVMAALAHAPEPEAAAALRKIEANCPFSLLVTLRALRGAKALGRLEACLDQELRIATRVTRRADFVEGVRAAVIDKDRRPAWSPARVADVAAAEVDACFRPLGPDELGLAARGRGA